MAFPKGIFYGWIVVFCSMILLALGVGMINSTNSMFVKPVCESLGFSRAQFSFYRTIFMFIGALLMPVYGRLIEKIGVKKVLLAGALMLGLASIGYSFTFSLRYFYMVAVVNGLFFDAINFMSIGVLISAWFNGKKGLATGLAYSGSGLGGAIMIPAVGRVIELVGWRWAYRLMGIFGIAVMMPVIIIFIKNTPGEMGLLPLEANKPEQKTNPLPAGNYSFREALHTRNFWLLFTAFFFISFFASAVNTHSAPYLNDLGYTTAYASSVMALYMIFLTMGKIILGSVYDYFGAFSGNLVISVFCLGFPVFAYLSHFHHNMPWVYAVFLGIASCGVTVPVSILVLRYFGTKGYSAIFSFFMAISSFSQSISIPAMGAVYDFTGSYTPAWIGFFIFSVVITVCLIKVEILSRN